MYQPQPAPNGAAVLKEVPAPNRFVFTYDGEADLVGKFSEQPQADSP